VDWIEDINKFVGYPDITIILDLPPEISLKRKRAHLETTGENSEKFETIEFLKRVRKKFLNRAKKKNYIVINSEEKIDRVQEEIQNCVKKIIKF
jgi:dTMP kinase